MLNAGPLSRGRFLAVLASIAVAASGYLAAALWSGWGQVRAAFAQVGWSDTHVVLALSFVSYLIRSMRWAVFMKALGHPLAPAVNVRIYFAGFALTTTPGRLGETLRSILLRPFQVPYAASIGAFFADRFCDLVGVLLVTAVLAQTLYPAAQSVALVLVVVLAVTFLMYVQEHRVLELVHNLARRISRKALVAVSARALAESALVCIRPRRFVLGVAVTCAAWGIQGLALAYLLSRLGSDLPLALTIFIFFFATLVGAATTIPAGLGGQEATMIGLLTLNGVDSAEAIAATLILRVATLWFGVALGLCCTVFPPLRGAPPAPQRPA